MLPSKRLPQLLAVMLSLMVAAHGYAVPPPTDQESSTTAEEYETTTHDVFTFEVPRFAQLLSIHIYFDHLDNAFSLLSNMISTRVHESIPLTIASSPMDSNVDVQILKGQLEGAINSYIEDQLPLMWNRRASALDKQSLQSYIENITLELCHPGPATNVCLEQNAPSFLARLDQYVSKHTRRVIYDVSDLDLPGLFETTRLQVQSTLAHFHRYVLQASDVQIQLEPLPSPSNLDTAQIKDIVQVVSRQITESEASISHFAMLARAFL